MIILLVILILSIKGVHVINYCLLKENYYSLKFINSLKNERKSRDGFPCFFFFSQQVRVNGWSLIG